MPDHIQFRRVGEEWTAVYLNGNLQTVGASYLADEWLAGHYGVEIVEDNAQDCMIDNHRAHGSLDAVAAVTAHREQREAAAAELRAQADALNGKADEIIAGR